MPDNKSRPPPGYAQSLELQQPTPSSTLLSSRGHSHTHNDDGDDRSSTNADSSSFVNVSRDTSRQATPFTQLDNKTSRQDGDDDSDSDFAWDEAERSEEEGYDHTMPSDLRPDHPRSKSHQHQPLLNGDRRTSYDQSVRPGLGSRQSTHFRERDPEIVESKDDVRTRYTYAAAFLLISLVSFAVQTETAVYIQHDLHWNKAYCMLYFTHGSWSVLWFVQLAILRIAKWNQPWDAFWRRHVAIIRSTAQMVEHRTLNVPTHLQKKSPWPYFIRTTAFVTCALTVAGGSWYVAVDMTTASDLTAIYNCSAFFAYAFAIPLLGEKLRWSKVASVIVAIVGVLVVAYGDQAHPKHGNKSGGGAGGPSAPDSSEAKNRALGNLVIGVGSVLYGFYEVLYKRVACPPDGCSPNRGMLFANTFGSMIGLFTLTVLWIPIPLLHYLGIEKFELPTGKASWMLAISVLSNATFSGSFLVLISLTSPVLSSVAALLTIFLVALCDELLPPPLYSPLTGAAMAGGLLIIFAFLLLSWFTYKEMEEERHKHAEEQVEESDTEDL
ncbi:Putative solute carrier family 35 member F3/F4 [Septoria linicola]|uniref:Solute carrier family 35 member F3/F4 n=1 Tax=Septoria linicola TaxID=215465 RepID=A0A9Q9AKS0_9PEZI|nr:Putative solute carrier family 35 member F3/F4 [Septoria linicola]